MALPKHELAALSRLLDQALALPAPERTPWLESLSGDDAVFRDRLRRLLARAAEDGVSAPLQSLPLLALDERPVASPGEHVGPWRLLREIGHGGMGTVWLAERADGAYERLLALKLPRVATSEDLVARMARERHIAARLEHPAIARLYDAGVDGQGRPFIAMEFVDGEPIDRWVREQALGPRQVMALFVQVVHAVAYAHGRLVVHRDIKPSNVMIGRDGRVHLLDFGIAGLLGDGDEAAVASTAGTGRALTPHYAAPEQLAGAALGVQADIYSLGVLLRELLTGQVPPRPGPWRVASSPEAVGSALPRTLSAILAKATAPLPADRYASADAMAEDLQRHLRGDSVSAAPETAWHTLARLARRHWRGLGAFAFGLAVLAGAGTLAALQARRAAEAQQREQHVRALVGELLGLDYRGLSQEQALQRQAERVRDRLPADWGLRADLHGQLAAAFQQLGLAHFAAEQATRQIEALDRVGAGAALQVPARLVLARSQLDNQDSEAAERTAREALARAAGQPALDAESRVVLARVLNRQTRRDEAARVLEGLPRPLPLSGPPGLLAQAWLDYTDAVARRQGGDFAGALPLYERAVARALEAGSLGAADAAQMRLDLAYELIVRNRRGEALAHMEPALQLMASSGPTGAELATAQRAALLTNMAMMGQIPAQEALDGLSGLHLALAQQGGSANPLALARLDFHRARLLGLRGHVREGYQLLERAVPPLLGAARWANARYSLVNAHGRMALLAGEHAQAAKLVAEALRLREEMGHARIPFAAVSHAYAAMSALMVGRLDDARLALDAAPAFEPERSDAVSGAVYAVLLPWLRARLHLEAGEPEAALALARRLGAGEEDLGDTDFVSPRAVSAELACSTGRPAAGLAQLDDMIRRRTATVDAAVDPTLARLRAWAGLCSLALGRREEARRHAVAAAAAFQRQPAVSPWFKAPLERLVRQLGD